MTHGTANCYKAGCRRQECRTANTLVTLAWRRSHGSELRERRLVLSAERIAAQRLANRDWAVTGRTEAEFAFAAGLIEGEGTVRISKPTQRNTGHLVVSCVNTNRQLTDWLQERWSGYCKPATGLRPEQRPAFVWTIAARRALAFLEAIEPYAVSDRMRERIETARWWQQIKSKHWRDRFEPDFEESFNCYHWMRALNKRGVR